ncbi:hypothetical protein CS8_062040 [Cupriavidus sp. 8B]
MARNSPCATGCRPASTIDNSSTTPCRRARTPQRTGASNSSEPSTASASATGPARAACHTAHGGADSHSRPSTSQCSNRCAGLSNQPASGAGTAAASNAIGVTSRLTSGIAAALASGEITETCWNSSKVSGTSPMVTDHCVRVACARLARKRCQRVSVA